MPQVLKRPLAEVDLDDIWWYIAQDNPDAADRFELLHAIKTESPSSINQLAKLVKRDIKNVANDVAYLIQIGLIRPQETKRQISPRVDYEQIVLEIAV
jgi:predicted transcriptional regulator